MARADGRVSHPKLVNPELFRRQYHAQSVILLAALSICVFVVVFTQSASKAEWLLFLTVLLLLGSGLWCVFHNTAYSAYPDVVGDGRRMLGACHVEGDEDPDDIVRTLYQFASYGSLKTVWPIFGIFSLGASVVLASIVKDDQRWISKVLLCYIILTVLFLFVLGFCDAHGEVQAQMFRDSVYCRYVALRGMRRARGGACNSALPQKQSEQDLKI